MPTLYTHQTPAILALVRHAPGMDGGWFLFIDRPTHTQDITGPYATAITARAALPRIMCPGPYIPGTCPALAWSRSRDTSPLTMAPIFDPRTIAARTLATWQHLAGNLPSKIIKIAKTLPPGYTCTPQGSLAVVRDSSNNSIAYLI